LSRTRTVFRAAALARGRRNSSSGRMPALRTCGWRIQAPTAALPTHDSIVSRAAWLNGFGPVQVAIVERSAGTVSPTPSSEMQLSLPLPS
jgi:hypothetical protein